MKRLFLTSLLFLGIKHSIQAQTTCQLIDSNYTNGDSYNNFKTNRNANKTLAYIERENVLVAINDKVYKLNSPEMFASLKDSITSMHIFVDTAAKATIKKMIYYTTVPKQH